MTGKPDAGLYIDPPTHHFLGDRLFDSATVPFGGDDILAPYRCIREAFAARGIPVHTADTIHKAPASQRKLYVSMGRIPPFEALAGRSDVVLSAFFAMECPIVEPSLYRALPRVGRHVKRIFSWSDSASLARFTGEPVPVEPFRWPQCFDAMDGNDDGQVDLSDPIFLLGFFFGGGPRIPQPYPQAAQDPTEDALPACQRV